jgi:hypothetical protein
VYSKLGEIRAVLYEQKIMVFYGKGVRGREHLEDPLLDGR